LEIKYKRNKIELNDADENIVQFGLDLFNIFSNQDTLKIFLYAEDGIESSKRAMKELRLTPKRYYSRLGELVKMGILEKDGKIYRYTPLGQALYQLGYYFYDILKNKDKLRFIGEVITSNVLKPYEIKKVMDIVSEDSEGLEIVLKSLINRDRIEIVEKIDDYEELVNKLVSDIDSAQKSVYLASRYLDLRVVEASCKAQKRGIDMKGLLSKELLFNKINLIKFLLFPTILKLVFEIFSTNDHLVREYDIPYSFCIIDELICYFELPSIDGDFSIAFRVIDKKLARKFNKIFFNLWDKSDIKGVFDFLNILKRKGQDAYKEGEL